MKTPLMKDPATTFGDQKRQTMETLSLTPPSVPCHGLYLFFLGYYKHR